jgi:hypothetical protein
MSKISKSLKFNFWKKFKLRILSEFIQFLEKRGFEINRKPTEKIHPKILKNIFGSDYLKRALVSFIQEPFVHKTTFFYHTNRIEAELLCQIPHEMGFQVDLVNFNDDKFELTDNYDLLIGFGNAIDELIMQFPTKPFPLILYRNGFDGVFSDRIVNVRLSDFYSKYGSIPIVSSNIYPLGHRTQIWFADVLIALGNDVVAETFRENTLGKIHSVDLFYFDVGHIDLEKKDFERAKNNFLWFGSLGALWKGLDITLEYFMLHPEVQLYIAGFNPKETVFRQSMHTFFELPNVHVLNFVKMESPEFFELLYTCSAAIFPTSGEGGGGAMLNLCAAGGLIPIVTENIGLDFDDQEYIIKEFTVESVHNTIQQFQDQTNKQLLDRSDRIMKFIRSKHTMDNYKNSITQIIKNVAK